VLIFYFGIIVDNCLFEVVVLKYCNQFIMDVLVKLFEIV